MLGEGGRWFRGYRPVPRLYPRRGVAFCVGSGVVLRGRGHGGAWVTVQGRAEIRQAWRSMGALRGVAIPCPCVVPLCGRGFCTTGLGAGYRAFVLYEPFRGCSGRRGFARHGLTEPGAGVLVCGVGRGDGIVVVYHG